MILKSLKRISNFKRYYFSSESDTIIEKIIEGGTI
jgi:hypothetical protein